MASLINSVRNIIGDSLWFPKLAVFTFLVYEIYINKGYIPDTSSVYFLIFIAFCLLMLGCCSIMMHRNINNIVPILPGLSDIPQVIIKSIFSLFIILPGVLLMSLALSFINTLTLDDVVRIILIVSIIIFCIPIIAIPLVLYSVKFNINDALRFNIISQSAGGFLVQLISYIVQFIFTIFLTAFLIYEVLINMFETTDFMVIIMAFFVVLTVFSMFSYFSDLYADTILEIENNKKMY